jgi:hypothetical protein
MEKDIVFSKAHCIINEYKIALLNQRYNCYKFSIGYLFISPRNYIKFKIEDKIESYHHRNNIIGKNLFILSETIKYILSFPYYLLLYLIRLFYTSQAIKLKLQDYENYIARLGKSKINFHSLVISDFIIFWGKYGLDSEFSIKERKDCLTQIVSVILKDKITVDEFTILAENRVKESRERTKEYYRVKNALVSFNENTDFSIWIKFVDELLFGEKEILKMPDRCN